MFFYKQHKSFTYTFSGCLLFVFLIAPYLIKSQNTAVAHSVKPITATFVEQDIEFNDLPIISNVIRIKNNNAKTYTFKVKLSLPLGWSTINNPDKEYSLSPNDSLFVPIRIMTKKEFAAGGTKYNISAFISTVEGRQMAIANFRAGRPKINDWQIHVLPRPRIYFLNNENEAPFQINVSNYGDEPQELMLSMNKIGKDFIVTDGAGNFNKKSYHEFTLAPISDSTMQFIAKVQKPDRNLVRIDNYGYIPNAVESERHFGLYIRAAEVGAKPGKVVNKSKKIDFVKLGNSINFIKLSDATRISQHGSATIPLTMIANINNILGQQPTMNTVFNGNTPVNAKSSLYYFVSSNFVHYKVNSQTTANAAGVVTYNHQKAFVSVGSNVGLSLDNLRGIVNGRGVAAGYRFTPKQTIGVQYLRTGKSFFDYRTTTIGSAYSMRLSKFRFNIGYNNITDTAKNFTHTVNSNMSILIRKSHNLSLNGRVSNVNFGGVSTTNLMYGATYSFRYSKNRGNTSIGYNYSEGNGNIALGGLRPEKTRNYRGTLMNSYRFKSGVKLQLMNNYNNFIIPALAPATNGVNNILFNNVFTIQPKVKAGWNYLPGVYVMYSNLNSERQLSEGVQLNVNMSNLDAYYRMGFFAKAGYNQVLNHPELGTFFTGQFNVVQAYRTWTVIMRYAYGPTNRGNMVYALEKARRYPQTLGVSVNNQYQFRNPHFLWENTANYNFINVNQRSNLGLFSQLYYYTNSGWRFDVNISYNLNIAQNNKYVYVQGAANNFVIEEGPKTYTPTFQLGAGVKKDFAIPIPKKWRKTQFCNAHFKTFLDINGNKKFDTGEIPLENVVIRMNDYEVLTNQNGEAQFINMKFDSYKLQLLSLVDIGAWFPVVGDSIEVCGPEMIYIPYSKGVEVLGNVMIDREKYSAGMIEDLDVSRFKIYLVDSMGNNISAITDNRGNFKFYVPYGHYRLTFDEKMLGENFELAENDIELDLVDGMESYYHTFFIIEKKRRVKKKKFGADGSVTETMEEADSYNQKGSLNGNEVGPYKNANKKFGGFDDENGAGKSGGDKQKENVENLKTFDGTKTDEDKKKGSGQQQNEAVENFQTFGGAGDKDKFKSSSGSAVGSGINWAQMDSLINILIGKADVADGLSAADLAKIEESKVSKGDLSKFADRTVYTIQIGAYSNGLPRNLLAEILNLDVKVESFVDPKDGLTKYFTGYFNSYAEAQAAREEIESRGLEGPFLIVINNSEIMSVQDLLKKQQVDKIGE